MLLPKAFHPKSATPKNASPKSISPKSVTPKNASPKSISPKSVTPKNASPKSISPKSAPKTPVTTVASKSVSSKDGNINTNTVATYEGDDFLDNTDIFRDLLKQPVPIQTKTIETVHCSIAANPIKCSTTSIPIDKYSQQFLFKQIKKKICENVNREISSDCGLKLDEEHFEKKNLDIGNVEVDCLEMPIRASTPTPPPNTDVHPELDLTIMAGNMKITRQQDNIIRIFPNDFDEATEELPTMICVPETPPKEMPGAENDRTFDEEDSDEMYLPFMKKMSEKRKYITSRIKEEKEKYEITHCGETILTEKSEVGSRRKIGEVGARRKLDMDNDECAGCSDKQMNAAMDKEKAYDICKYSQVGPSAQKHNKSFCRMWVANSAPVINTTFTVRPDEFQTNNCESLLDNLTSVSRQKPQQQKNPIKSSTSTGINTNHVDAFNKVFVYV